ncbi:hypothetical protein AB2M62_08105 [Sphingomonas sp. MMS12-HWE2-04]|uniref:hypothetical protein n=1 Tax=Sphingomonas sp. MMS12-HWE2-04 TaxID=3234199 RepID=UPI00384A474C
MQPSLILCRTQEARQRALASAATLDNVRNLANLAAAAWAKEAKAAEQREDRKLRTRADADALQDRGMSENPDRGHAEIAFA